MPRSFSPATAGFDYQRYEAMIPMRDGVRLHTVIVIPKAGARPAPIILTRTPYGVEKPTSVISSPHAAMILPSSDEALVDAGYIRVYQDIRGRFGSEGDFVMNLPVRGELNPGPADETTDTWDTIDWLVKNVPGNNGRVGMTGISYAGWTTLMGILEPHPALKAVAPMYSMVDGWIGDDFYHNGALRQEMFDWIYNIGTDKSRRYMPAYGYRDLFEAHMAAGSAEAFARRYGGDMLPMWRKIVDHPTYDAFWRGQAVQDLLARSELKVPVLFVHGWFDQEDNFGTLAAYDALKAKDRRNDMVYLVAGPWNHGQALKDGSSLGPLSWGSDTSLWFRETILLPFWNHFLKDEALARPLPPVLAFDTGTHQWKSYQRWPADGKASSTRLYFQPNDRLGFQPPPAARPAYAEYVSDPAKPVPYRIRPILPMTNDDSTWPSWLVDDQRPFADRPDVLTFATEPLSSPVTISGPISAILFASTSGTDADWVVKLIDVFPPEVRANPGLGGYELMISADIMRGRYRDSLQQPAPARPGKIARYRIRMPEANHTFAAGHRIMIQVQSSWFPLYDRNPQTFVPNVAKARPEDYRTATHRVYFEPGQASYVELPVVAAGGD